MSVCVAKSLRCASIDIASQNQRHKCVRRLPQAADIQEAGADMPNGHIYAAAESGVSKQHVCEERVNVPSAPAMSPNPLLAARSYFVPVPLRLPLPLRE